MKKKSKTCPNSVRIASRMIPYKVGPKVVGYFFPDIRFDKIYPTGKA